MNDSRYKKVQRLTNAIRNIQPLGVFTLIDKQWYHKGKAISEAEKITIARSYEKVINIHPKQMA